jgi:hypothetical protein
MSQIFKTQIDQKNFFDFLEKICIKTEKYYIFDINSYKRAQLQDVIESFSLLIKPYYYESKQFYVNRTLSYSRLCTIIRQICNFSSILYTTKIVYTNSKYNIPYYIYF